MRCELGARLEAAFPQDRHGASPSNQGLSLIPKWPRAFRSCVLGAVGSTPASRTRPGVLQWTSAYSVKVWSGDALELAHDRPGRRLPRRCHADRLAQPALFPPVQNPGLPSLTHQHLYSLEGAVVMVVRGHLEGGHRRCPHRWLSSTRRSCGRPGCRRPRVRASRPSLPVGGRTRRRT